MTRAQIIRELMSPTTLDSTQLGDLLQAARDAALEEAALLVESAAGYWPAGLRVAVAIRARKGAGR